MAELLEEEATRLAPDEACGLLVGGRSGATVRVTRAVPCENALSPERRARRFAIDPRRVIEEERASRGSGEEVVGFYHSHPVGEPIPSSVDRGFMSLWPDSVWVIVGLEPAEGSVEIRGWVAAPDPSEPPREVDVERRSPAVRSDRKHTTDPDREEGNEGP